MLGGVVEQVDEDLRHASRIRVEVERLVRQADVELEAVLLELRAAGLERGLDDGAHVNALRPHPDLFLDDAGQVDQVLDDARQLTRLPIQHFTRASRSPRDRRRPGA